jgi:hypothetical protein
VTVNGTLENSTGEVLSLTDGVHATAIQFDGIPVISFYGIS